MKKRGRLTTSETASFIFFLSENGFDIEDPQPTSSILRQIFVIYLSREKFEISLGLSASLATFQEVLYIHSVIL